MAFLLAALVCLAVSLIAWCCPFDITGCGMLMCVLGIAFSVFGLASIVLVSFFKIKFIMLIYAGFGVALFSLYLMFDTQQIMGGKRVELSPEEYVLGALQLYIDMIEIFLHLLPLVAACFSDD
ncbi:protein lifeguard 3-like [Nilaparvata lugens]|nr:protein lifeguard 3-like [Nilaparvata lugens]